MSEVLLVSSLWLHSLATVLMIGFYLLLSLVYLPYLSKQLRGAEIASALDAVSARFRPWLMASLLVFAATGTYLTCGDEYYLGFARFNNAWSLLMLAKHVLVVVMIGLGTCFNVALRGALAAPAGRPESLNRVRLAVHAQAICGVLVLLLTALAQVL